MNKDFRLKISASSLVLLFTNPGLELITRLIIRYLTGQDMLNLRFCLDQFGMCHQLNAVPYWVNLYQRFQKDITIPNWLVLKKARGGIMANHVIIYLITQCIKNDDNAAITPLEAVVKYRKLILIKVLIEKYPSKLFKKLKQFISVNLMYDDFKQFRDLKN